MKNLFLFVAMLIAASAFFACNDEKTPQELMKEEKKAIEHFITQNEFIITADTSKMKEERTYYKTPDGLYLHVINPGNGNKAKYRTEVYARFKDAVLFKSDTIKFSNTDVANAPETFLYQYSYASSNHAGPGWDIALSYVSENGEVSMIVPSSLRNSYYQSSYSPIYYGSVKFRFY